MGPRQEMAPALVRAGDRDRTPVEGNRPMAETLAAPVGQRGYKNQPTWAVARRAVTIAVLPYPVDEVAVERLMAGDLPDYFTSHERREAVRRLRARGATIRQIAVRMRMHHRHVDRDLSWRPQGSSTLGTTDA